MIIEPMQTLQPPLSHEEPPAAHRRPEAFDLVAAALLLATVVLHVVAMFPSYFSTGGALTGTADQAAEYAVLAAAWALALGFGLTGPHRTPVAAGLAIGTALGELGFRLYDVGDVVRYGIDKAGPGLWVMTAAWVVGAAAALIAGLAARRRHGPPRPEAPAPAEPPGYEVPEVDWAAPVLDPPAAAEPGDQTLSVPLPDPTRTDVTSVDIGTVEPGHDPDHADRQERWAWTLLVAVLAIATAGAFLPAWDRYMVYSPTTGAVEKTITLGNAFNDDWQQVIGTVLAAVAILVVPIVAIRMKHRAAAAGAICGLLLVLSTQLVSAVVSVDEPVGTFVTLHLTGWFTADALAAYALFAAVMVWATLREAPAEGLYANSPAGPGSDPLARSSAMPFSS